MDTNTAVVFPGAIAAKRLKKKSVWHIREIISSALENKMISFMMDRYADLIIANSKATGDALLVNQDKVRVVYNAVDEKKTSGNVPHELITVGMAGRINRWKGQKLLVDAAAIVHKECPDVIFEIAGETYQGEDQIKADLESYITKKKLENTVRLLGQINDMESFYLSLDVFILPSIQPEPFGLVVIEAMEYKLPVVATNHGGPTEIITDGQDGYLVDYRNAQEMAKRIIELVKNEELRKRMGEFGLKKKRAQFSVSAMVQGIEAVFEEVAN